MLNRQVRQIYPQQDKGTQTVVFSDYSDFPNIVLLGDPGVGKTHLFTYHELSLATARISLS